MSRPAWIALPLLASGCLINTELRDDRIDALEDSGLTTTTTTCTAPESWYADADGDGYGDPDTRVSGCESPPPTYIADGTDCDDADPAVHPGATEGALGDRDCDGTDGSGSLADADGRLVGSPDTILGARVGPVGDFDGDGNADFAIGEAQYFGVGRVWLVTDGASFPTGLISDHAVDGRAPAGTDAGGAFAGIGDVNSDGLDDLLVGGPSLDEGRLWLVPGNANPQSQTLSMMPIQFIGENLGDRAGAAIAGGGDASGDGVPDFAIGAPYYGANTSDGAVYIRLGGTLSPGVNDLGLSSAILYGSSGSEAGTALDLAGDVDGDGLADLVIGAPGWGPAGYGPGAAFVVLADTALGSVDLATESILLGGEVDGDRAGQSVAGVGDVDGDGFSDVLVGAPNRGGDYGGGAYLVRGASGGMPSANLDLASVRFEPANAGDQVGFSVGAAGDVDGDGNSDGLIGAIGYAQSRGVSYLVFGSSLTGTFDLANAPYQLVGEADGEASGFTVSGVGDLDGDGRDDLAVGAPFALQPPYSYTGALYLIRGFTP